MLIVGIAQRLLRPEFLTGNTTLVSENLDVPGIIEDILQVLPDTKNIVVILGASPFEQFWVAETRREFQPFANRVNFTWFNDLSLEEMQRRAAALSPHSVILFGTLIVDAAGVPYDHDDALKKLHAVAKTPIFGYFQSQLGMGTVGGRLYQDQTVGLEAARVAVRILNGEPASSIPPRFLARSLPVYDWRELRRWSINESRLPPGSIVQFREPTLWQQYRWHMIAVAALCLAQSVLISKLLIQRRRRRLAEREAESLAGRLITAHEDERRRLARDLHDDLTQGLARLAIDAGKIERGAPVVNHDEAGWSMREELVRLSEDVHALSYRLHPSLLDDLGLVEALNAECDGFSRRESIPVEFKPRDVPRDVRPDAALCLFRVAQESLRNVARHAGASAVEVSLRKVDGGLEMAVHDNGTGFDSAEDRGRHSLGLASMKERVHLLGGELDIDSAPGSGTTVIAWVRLNEEGKS